MLPGSPRVLEPDGKLAAFRRALEETLFPVRCVGCGRRGAELCDSCVSTIRPLLPSSCPRCGRSSRLGSVCDRCRGYRGPLDGIRSAAVYEGVLRKAVHAFKYRQRQSLAEPLANLIVQELLRRPLRVDLLVPVPLHPRRLWERGYNQAFLLADRLGERLGIPVVEGLARGRETTAQAGLNASDRRSNVGGAFRCIDAGVIQGKRVGIVDDVCTTGATLEDCARALHEGESIGTWGIVVARDL